MKTIYKSNQAIAVSASRKLTSAAMITLMLMMVNCNRLFSQTNKHDKLHMNMGVDAYISGSDHGMFYSGYLGLSGGRHLLNAGPCIQGHSMLIHGGRLSYGYILTGYKDNSSLTSRLESQDDKIQLRVFSYVQYVDKLPLSQAAVTREEKLSSRQNAENNLSSVRFSTAEAGLGISLNIKVARNVYWRNSLTISGFYHTNCPVNLCQGRQGAVLSIGTGFNIPSL